MLYCVGAFMNQNLTFPEGFLWGASTSAYQIEGAVRADGRGESIWDRFSHTPGHVVNGDTGDVACDHYHRWEEDVALVAELGLSAYRLTVAWPRVVPEGSGPVNEAGLGFYDRLVDALLAKGIEPMVVLYHWDLPQMLEERGGWPARATALAFADYAAVVAARLGDRVRLIATCNEPWCSATLGYLTGEHAPGRRSREGALAAGHHLLLAHGLGAQAIRAAAPGARVGIILDFAPQHPASDDPRDVALAAVADAQRNRWYLDPLTGRGYPEEGVAAHHWAMEEVLPGDLDTICQPLDFLGVNYYSRHVVRSPELPQQAPGLRRPSPHVTDMGWEIYPPGLTETLVRLDAEYRVGPLYVTENGAAFRDASPAPPFNDLRRIAYLRDHLAAVHTAIEQGAPVRGYFVWSLLDNFEWALGYSQRFGLVHVNHDTQERTVRASGRWYAAAAAAGRVAVD